MSKRSNLFFLLIYLIYFAVYMLVKWMIFTPILFLEILNQVPLSTLKLENMEVSDSLNLVINGQKDFVMHIKQSTAARLSQTPSFNTLNSSCKKNIIFIIFFPIYFICFNRKNKRDISISVYTQITDVETECDGYFNMDRTNKFSAQDTQRLIQANQNLIDTPAWIKIKKEIFVKKIF